MCNKGKLLIQPQNLKLTQTYGTEKEKYLRIVVIINLKINLKKDLLQPENFVAFVPSAVTKSFLNKNDFLIRDQSVPDLMGPYLV